MLLIVAFAFSSQGFAIEVVANIQVPESQLSQSQLRRIYTMRQLRWSDNTSITVFVLPSQHLLHHRFAKERLQIFPYQLNRIWHKLTYSGLGVAPIIVYSEEELIQAVMDTPGAIGYINDRALIELRSDKDIQASGMREKQIVSKENLHVLNITD